MAQIFVWLLHMEQHLSNLPNTENFVCVCVHHMNQASDSKPKSFHPYLHLILLVGRRQGTKRKLRCSPFQPCAQMRQIGFPCKVVTRNMWSTKRVSQTRNVTCHQHLGCLLQTCSSKYLHTTAKSLVCLLHMGQYFSNLLGTTEKFLVQLWQFSLSLMNQASHTKPKSFHPYLQLIVLVGRRQGTR